MSTAVEVLRHYLNPDLHPESYVRPQDIIAALDGAGFAVVPKEPTKTMLECGHGAGWHGGIEGLHDAEEEFAHMLWGRMLAASPFVDVNKKSTE